MTRIGSGRLALGAVTATVVAAAIGIAGSPAASADTHNTTSTSKPRPVSNATPYLDVVKGLVAAEHGLQTGALSIADVPAGAPYAKQLADAAPAAQGVRHALAAGHQRITDDHSTLTGTSVTRSVDGRTVTVKGTVKRTLTTIDTSGGKTKRFPGADETPGVWTFDVTGAHPVLTGYRATDTDTDTAAEPHASTTPSTRPAPKPIATDAKTGLPVAGPAGQQPKDHYGDQAGIAAWAMDNWNGDDNGYDDDCTDFASRAMFNGGGMPQNEPWFPIFHYRDDDYWFSPQINSPASYSWGGAFNNSDYENRQGAQFLSYSNDAVPGDIIWVNWTSDDWSHINHTAVVTGNDGTNLYITQHTNNRLNEPVWFVPGEQTWQGSNPNLVIWIAVPYEKN